MTPERRLLRDGRLQLSLAAAIAVMLLGCLPSTALAQNRGPGVAAGDLPGDPQPQASSQSGSQQPAASAALTGAVTDTTGAAIPNARIELLPAAGSAPRTTTSGEHGDFSFPQLPPGAYTLTVSATGFSPYTSPSLTLTPGRPAELPEIRLIASANIDVTVLPTEVIAARQVHAEEQQRVLGIIPNFYTSFAHDAAPLTPKQKLSLTLRGAFDPFRFVGSAAVAGIEQANDTYPGYGYGAAGYGKRYAAAFGDGLTQDVLSHSVFPILFHQDPRYFYQGTGSFRSRALHAISFAVITRTDSGGQAFNYSAVFGDLGSGALSNLYYPHANRGVGLVFSKAAVNVGGRAAGNLLREFILKPLTTHAHVTGTP